MDRIGTLEVIVWLFAWVNYTLPFLLELRAISCYSCMLSLPITKIHDAAPTRITCTYMNETVENVQ